MCCFFFLDVVKSSLIKCTRSITQKASGIEVTFQDVQIL